MPEYKDRYLTIYGQIFRFVQLPLFVLREIVVGVRCAHYIHSVGDARLDGEAAFVHPVRHRVAGSEVLVIVRQAHRAQPLGDDLGEPFLCFRVGLQAAVEPRASEHRQLGHHYKLHAEAFAQQVGHHSHYLFAIQAGHLYIIGGEEHHIPLFAGANSLQPPWLHHHGHLGVKTAKVSITFFVCHGKSIFRYRYA